MYVLPRNLLITYIPKHSSRLIIHFTLLVWIQLKRKRDNKNKNMNTLTAANMLCTFVNQRQQVLCLVHNWIMNQGQDQGLQKEKWLTPSMFMNLSYDYCMYWFLNRHGGVKNKIKLSDYKLNTKGQLISKANFKVFIWTKKRTKYFCISALASKKP